MKKIIIEYKNFILKVHISEDNTTILNSYVVKRTSDMEYILHKIKANASNKYAINKRGIPSMIREWRVHNLLYSIGLFKTRTKDVDLNIGDPWYIKTLYFILSPLYLNF